METLRLRESVGLSVVLRRTDATVCLSERERETRIAQFPAEGKRFFVIPNGLELDCEPQHLRAWRAPERFRLLFVGQLKCVKRVDRAITAVAANPGTELRLVYHNDSAEGTLRSLARTLGVEDRVTFVGQRYGFDLREEYRSAHALVLPSRSEALPSVVTEALLTGLPVLASDVGGVSSQVGDAGILMNPTDDENLSASVGHAILCYASLARRAFARAEEIRAAYSIDRMVDMHLDLYRSLLCQTP